MYSVQLSTHVKKSLRKFDSFTNSRVLKKLQTLSENPFPKDAKFLGRDDGDKIFRVRIGFFRVLYSVDEDNLRILIFKIDKRSRVYHR